MKAQVLRGSNRLEMQTAFAGISVNHCLVWNAAQEGTGEDEQTKEYHLPGGGAIECVDPVAIRVIDDAVSFAGELPDGVVTVGDSAGAREDER